MVAKITMPITINRALNYNEQKVQQGKAHCIGEGNMLLPASSMNFYQKLEVFENRNKLNERADTKTIHISLNFDPSENHEREKLNMIAVDYMTRIGFGDQPYLVYQHYDAAHPHIHIVSTTIRENGSRINTHNIGKNQSEIARKAVEEIHTLIPAHKQEKIIGYELRPLEIEKAKYGYSETRRSIANIVSHVANKFNFVSLPAYNALLKQYNIIADEGKEGGIIRKNKGLQYRILDAGGNKIGVPIKASALPGVPTIANLEKKFALNQTKREIPKLALKNTIDDLLQKKPGTLDRLIEELKTQKVETVLRTNDENRIYGITFVDMKNRSVFNGSELGKPYSIAGLQKQFKKPYDPKRFQHHHEKELNTDLIDTLLNPENEQEQIDFELRKKRKKDGTH